MSRRAATVTADVGAVSPRLVDYPGAARYFGNVDQRTVRTLVENQELIPVRLPSSRHAGESGRRVLFDICDLDALIEKWKLAATSAPNPGLRAAAIEGWRRSPVRTRKGTATRS
jgi:hypothetical protein